MSHSHWDWGGEVRHQKLWDKQHRPSIYAVILLSLITVLLIFLTTQAVATNSRLKNYELEYPLTKRIGIISDIHLDLNQNVTTCVGRSGSGYYYRHHYPTSYGVGGCDASYEFAKLTIKSFFSKNVFKNGNCEMIMHIGDQVGHPNLVENNMRNTIHELTKLFLFYNEYHVPVYFTLGTNDIPEGRVSREDIGLLYESIWSIAQQLFYQASDKLQHARESFVRYGYYYLEHSRHLWVVSLNTPDFLPSRNVSRETVTQQLEWLAVTLEKAKLSNVHVYLIGHSSPQLKLRGIVPSSRLVNVSWKTEYILTYNNIVSQYSDIIKFVFYGNHHADNFFCSSQNVWNYVFPAVSPFSPGQPSYIFAVASSTWDILDLWFYYSPREMYTRLNLRPAFIFHYSLKVMFFHSSEKLTPINSTLLRRLISDIAHPRDMLRTYDAIRKNNLQLQYQFHISPYQMYCVMAHNTPDQLKQCLSKFYY